MLMLDPQYDANGILIAKRCRRCLGMYEIGAFYKHEGDSRHSICKYCFSERSWPTYERQKAERRDNRFRAKYILKDANGMDRKLGFVNDLTLEWITEAIAAGCEYCGETEVRMTLDRKDNAKGHDIYNVVPACMRCNFLRKTMPYDAWLCIVPGVRSARERGLFGAWTGFFDRSGRKRHSRPRPIPLKDSVRQTLVRVVE